MAGDNLKNIEKENLERVKGLPCVICGHTQPSAAHHIGIKMGKRKNHLRIIALCYRHHQGDEGFHTLGRKKWEARYGTEEELYERAETAPIPFRPGVA
jgi:hypothetical protein